VRRLSLKLLESFWRAPISRRLEAANSCQASRRLLPSMACFSIIMSGDHLHFFAFPLLC
jgi:hypothetical protein